MGAVSNGSGASLANMRVAMLEGGCAEHSVPEEAVLRARAECAS